MSRAGEIRYMGSDRRETALIRRTATIAIAGGEVLQPFASAVAAAPTSSGVIRTPNWLRWSSAERRT